MLKTTVVTEPGAAVCGVGVLLEVEVVVAGTDTTIDDISELVDCGSDAKVEARDAEDDAGGKEETEDIGWRVDCSTKMLAFEYP